MAKRKQAAAKSRRGGAKAVAQISLREVWEAVESARDWLAARGDYYAYLVRRQGSRGAPELAGHLRGDIQARQRDGSWGEGDLVVTAEAIWKLLELGMRPEAPAVARGLNWMYERRDEDGAYSHGCTPSRHDQQLCEHYLSGFFSPGPSDEAQEVALPNGQTVTSDVGARLLASERATRAALRAHASESRVAASVLGLRSLPLFLEYGGTFTPAVLVGAVQALAWAGVDAAAEVNAGVETLAVNQDGDGTWPNVEFFFVLETLLELPYENVGSMLEAAVPRLLDSQHKNGSWGRRNQAPQTWIAAQALERVGAKLKVRD